MNYIPTPSGKIMVNFNAVERIEERLSEPGLRPSVVLHLMSGAAVEFEGFDIRKMIEWVKKNGVVS